MTAYLYYGLSSHHFITFISFRSLPLFLSRTRWGEWLFGSNDVSRDCSEYDEIFGFGDEFGGIIVFVYWVLSGWIF